MKKILSIPIIILSLATIYQSCDTLSNVQETFQSQVEFTFSTGQLKNGNEQGLTYVVVTIEDLNGKVVKNSEKIEIYNMNGYYISKPISIVTEEYKLTRFLVLNANNEVVYASPLEGSAKAYLVQKPLPIAFLSKKDEITKLTPEVLSTSESRPEDFGYVTFSFQIANTFDFLVGAAIYNDLSKNFDLTSASISIYNNSALLYSGQLVANTSSTNSNYDPLGITNKITLPERFNDFTINISKAGYVSYSKAFTKEELRMYYRKEDKGPLVVILNKNKIDITSGLLAYYPFNGNTNDESGNGNNGVNHGATLTTDRKGKTNSAYSFDGISNYISVNNSAVLCPTSAISVSAWAYAYDLNNRHMVVDKRINYNDSPWNSYILEADYATSSQCWVSEVSTNSSIAVARSSTVTVANRWYHLLLTHDGITFSLYVDGVLVNSKALSGNITYSNMPLYIGTSALNTFYMKGKVDDVRIYNRALSMQEINALYNE